MWLNDEWAADPGARRLQIRTQQSHMVGKRGWEAPAHGVSSTKKVAKAQGPLTIKPTGMGNAREVTLF